MVDATKSPKKTNSHSKPAKRKSKKKKEAPPNAPTVEEEEDFYTETTKRIIRPIDQLVLTEKELKEEISRVLTGDDPNVPKNITKYNFKERRYKLDPPGLSDHMAVHFSLEANSLHIESKEYRKQQELKEKESSGIRLLIDKNGSNGDGSTRPESTMEVNDPQKNRNHFNYSDRSAQTFNNPLKSRGISTEPPQVTQYNASVTQWQIHDCYLSEYMIHKVEHDHGGTNEKKNITFKDRLAIFSDEDNNKEQDIMQSDNIVSSLRIMERLVNQNSQDEIYQDFKYWEDASDQFREGEGSLLPLWKFSTERTRRKQVTAICWNPKYADLFAVGYGSYDFLRQGSGMICCYSMKNTSFPEYIFSTESGIMCLDFHPQHPSLLAVGCYDGNVMVYDVCNGSIKPIYSSSIRTGKHNDPVWQLHWQKEDFGKELNFYSVSSDGQVANWSMSKNELKMEPIMHLKIMNSAKDEPDEASLSGLAGGCCFDFSEMQKHLFIVGTEEGNIHKCSKAYSGQYLETYEGHHMAVYAVKWNPFHENIFISCSADWTVKLWDHNIDTPLLSFDLGNSVGDVSFSPYSSTVFSAVTNDGKVLIFDLIENKHDPLCEQKVVKRGRLTHARFNSQDNILIVGDDRGGVNSLKLSPNLRKLHLKTDEDSNPLPGLNVAERQREKLENLIVSLDIKSQ